jgi:hypothetical protein
MRHHVGVLETLWSGFAVVASFAMCIAVVYFLISGRDDRAREEEAREYFDQHGHWPDEAG